MSNLSFDRASSLLDYDKQTGHLYWKAPKNKKLAGRPAGCINSGGYRVIQIDGLLRLAHRVVWLLCVGRDPDHDVDHINGDRSDNRFENLRDVLRNHNNQNIRRPYSTSSTGLLGAHRCGGKRGGFQSSIHANGKCIALGHFKTAEEAHAAYMRAKRELHPGFIKLEAAE